MVDTNAATLIELDTGMRRDDGVLPRLVIAQRGELLAKTV
jgi:hypothetical protein